MKKDSFCNYCGTILNEASYPKHCLGCGKEIYNNPLPVSVSALFCYDRSLDKFGLIVIKRNIEPKLGEWALPGGYLEQGETWQEGAAREVYEEVGLDLQPNGFKLLTVETAPSNGNLLIFNYFRMMLYQNDFESFVTNDEVSEFKIIFAKEELAFSTHSNKIEELLKLIPTIMGGI